MHRYGFLIALLISGCESARDLDFAFETPASFSQSGAAAMPDFWWTEFGDRQLNQIQEQALQSNYSLESAWRRIEQARAVVDRQRAPLIPALDGAMEGGAGRGRGGNRNQRNFVGGGGGGAETERELSLGLEAFYEIDLWGRIRSEVEAERMRENATEADYRATALTISALVAQTWFQLVESWAQRDLLDRQIETNEKVREQLEIRFGEGQGRAVDVLRQTQLVKETRAQKTVVEANIGLLENQLAVLQGKAPQGRITNTRQALPQLPPLPRTGLPLELIQRRPDVMAAFYRVQSADATLAAAISDQYPRLNFAANLSSAGDNSADLFDSWFRSVAGELVAPLVDGGQRRAEVRRTEAVRAELMADYRQTILIAIREVEDSLVQERKQAERIAHLAEQVELAQRSYEQLLNDYLNGQGNYIDVLTALTEQQRLRRDLVTARLQVIEFRVGLYRALAGGFETKHDS